MLLINWHERIILSIVFSSNVREKLFRHGMFNAVCSFIKMVHLILERNGPSARTYLVLFGRLIKKKEGIIPLK